MDNFSERPYEESRYQTRGHRHRVHDPALSPSPLPQELVQAWKKEANRQTHRAWYKKLWLSCHGFPAAHSQNGCNGQPFGR